MNARWITHWGRMIKVMMALVATSLSPAMAQDSVQDKIIYARAVDSMLWSVPLMNYKALRDGFKEGASVGYNAVVYQSKVQTWELEVPTGNNTTPYVMLFWTTKDGPVVIEIPPRTEDVSLFGAFMDSWQRPIGDIGDRGRDGGLGARYLMLPPNYQGELPVGGYLVARQPTYEGYLLARPITAGLSEEGLAKAEALVKQIKVYPLAQADNPPPTRHVDAWRKRVKGVITFDESYFEDLHEILGQEYTETHDLVAMGQLAGLGIRKNLSYEVDKATKAIFRKAASDVHDYLVDRFFETYPPYFYDDRKWFTLDLPATVETLFSYIHPTWIDIDVRAAQYYAIFSSLERLGAATFYFFGSKDRSGKQLSGDEVYRLTVPANVPARDFWSVIVHDTRTSAWFTDIEIYKEGLSSFTDGLAKNEDGTVDVYFAPELPEDVNAANWLPTVRGKDFFLVFRFYGPEPELFAKTWKLNDLELVKD